MGRQFHFHGRVKSIFDNIIDNHTDAGYVKSMKISTVYLLMMT